MISDGRVVSNTESPGEEGLRLVRSPENTFFFWGKYDVKSGPLSGFTFGLGASYRSPARVQPNLPDRYRLSTEYTVARALIGYRYRLFNRQHAVTLNVENLFDKQYVDEANFLSEPRLVRFMYSIDW
jgi:outer membrane receptor protein involved in Fe transport